MSKRSLELKVGIFVFLALLLFVGFFALMTGVSLHPTYRVFVDFEDPGGLKSGAPIRIAGQRVGRVRSLQLLHGQLVPQEYKKPMTRVVAQIETQYQASIFTDATFSVALQGMIGEMHLAIDPGSLGKPVLAENSVVRGVSPPRIDQLLTESYRLLHQVSLGVAENEKRLHETWDGLHRTLQTTGRLAEKHEEDISRLIERMDRISALTEETLSAARKQYVDGPRIERIFERLDRSTQTLDENWASLVGDTRAVLKNSQKISAFLAEDEQMQALQGMSQGTRQLLGTAQKTADDLQIIVSQFKAGKGTAGALVMDEALYDDIKELVRDLKQNPWKIMWKN